MSPANGHDGTPPEAPGAARGASLSPRLVHSQLTRPVRLAFLAVTAFWAMATAAVVLAAGGGNNGAAAATAMAAFYAASGLTALLVRRWELHRVKELVDALNQTTQRLADLSTLDDLTGLHNRRYFYWQLERELGRARRYGTPFTIAIFDIDNLKRINDDLGHLAGDQLLRTFAQVMKEKARVTDTCARIGGDEFALLALNTSHQAAWALAERLAAAFAATPIDLSGLDVPGAPTITSSVSWGLSAYPPQNGAGNTLDTTDIISSADEDLSARKMERREARSGGQGR